LEALEHHPQRTWNIAQAVFVLVPISVTGTYFLGNRQDLGNAFYRVFFASKSKKLKLKSKVKLSNNNKSSSSISLFQQYPDEHVVAIATSESVFTKLWGLSRKELRHLKKMMTGRHRSSTTTPTIIYS